MIPGGEYDDGIGMLPRFRVSLKSITVTQDVSSPGAGLRALIKHAGSRRCDEGNETFEPKKDTYYSNDGAGKAGTTGGYPSVGHNITV